MAVPHSPDPEPRYAGSKRSDTYDERAELLDETPVDEAPPVGEEIHMPGPSMIPIINAVGVTVALLGVTSSVFLIVVGLIIVAVTTVMWVRDTLHELAELPAEHAHH